MPSEPIAAYVFMTVIDSAHPRYRQAGRVVSVSGDDERITDFVLEFAGGQRETFTPAQVRLVMEPRARA